MDVDIRPFNAAEARPADLVDYHELVLATGRVDRPGERPQSLDAVVGRLSVSAPGRGPCQHWAAYRQGRLIGMSEVAFPDAENDRIAMVEIRVHPELRRLGTGTGLLRAMLPTILARGRTVVAGWGVTEGGAGACWATARGFRLVHHDILQVLDLRTVDRSLWDCATPAEYRLAEWCGAAPAELIDSLAITRGAIADMPTEDSTYSLPSWTPARIRAEEQSMRSDGTEQRTVVVVRTVDATVAAFTELIILAARPTEALQRDTAVLTEHRGRGLGRLVKSAMLRRLAIERPAIDRILTSTAASNLHMINVNLGVGFQTVRKMVDVEADALELQRRCNVS